MDRKRQKVVYEQKLRLLQGSNIPDLGQVPITQILHEIWDFPDFKSPMCTKNAWKCLKLKCMRHSVDPENLDNKTDLGLHRGASKNTLHHGVRAVVSTQL